MFKGFYQECEASPGFGWFRACEGDSGFSISDMGFRLEELWVRVTRFRV